MEHSCKNSEEPGDSEVSGGEHNLQLTIRSPGDSSHAFTVVSFFKLASKVIGFGAGNVVHLVDSTCGMQEVLDLISSTLYTM